MEHFTYRSHLPAPADIVWDWHARPGALERLTPPWDRIRIVGRTGGLEDGARVTMSVPVGPLRVRWVSRHRDCVRGRGFVDEQIEGPFASWTHTHTMVDEPAAAGRGGSMLDDRIDYLPPYGAPGRWLAQRVMAGRLAALFRYRHETLRADLETHAAFAARPRLTVAMTGASGLVGSALAAFLTTGGHRVIRLVRRSASDPTSRDRQPIDPSAIDTAPWDPERGLVAPERLPRLDAVVHLAGESIAGGRWTEARKAAIRRSRLVGTAALAESLTRLPEPPASFLCASAIGFYGNRAEAVTEHDPPGKGFLADVCQAWEAAAAPAIAHGIRVVHLRLGLVLSPAGGLLGTLLPLFRVGLGGPVGSGRQAVSWIGIDDAVGAFHHALQHTGLQGPVNVTAPDAVTSRELARTLGRVLGRPALLAAPAFGVRLAMGREMADETALGGARVLPERLLASDYAFRFRQLEGALRHLLGR
jgi:uncharacterized protein (TIGR01777 family)